MMYRVVSYDRFEDYDDGQGPASEGEYESAAEALARAKAVIDHSLEHLSNQRSTTVEALLDDYGSFGQLPYINGEPKVEFDADAYARERAPIVLARSQPGRSA